MNRSLLFPAAMLAACISMAQNDGTSIWQGRSTTLGGGVEIGVPLGEFDFTWGNTTTGLSATLALPMRNLPLELGYDFAWGRMGSEQTVEQAPGNILAGPTGRRVDVASDVFGHHALLRLDPLRGRLRPYGDVMFGARNFITRSTVTTPQGLTDDERDGEWTTSYGWAVGAMYGMGRLLFLEGRVERLFNGRVSYVDPSTIEIASDGTVSYEKLSSRTDALMIQLGVGLRF